MKSGNAVNFRMGHLITALLALVLIVPQAFATTGTVISDLGLNIRQEPRGKILGALLPGSTFKVLARDGKWLHVQLRDSRRVYVWNPENANVAGAETIADGFGAAPIGRSTRQPLPVAAPSNYVANGNFRLRVAPRISGAVITTLNAGQSKFRILECQGDWLKVRTAEGKNGFIYKSGATEASACLYGECARPSKNPAKDDAGDILAKLEQQVSSVRGGGNACVRAEILKAAKVVVRRNYGNRPQSKGKCALGVRQALDRAGVNGGVGLGHAIDYHAKGVMKRKGFVNKIGQYNAQNAPPGAILVFSGPATKNYLRTGRMSAPYGNFVGHITVKGDDNRYYTDGRTVAPAIRNRYLVGVYVPDNLSKMSPAIRRKCR